VLCWQEFRFLEWLAEYMPDRPVTFFDAGANIGMASVLFAKVMRFTGEVLAVEANPETYAVLERNVAPFRESIRTVPAALTTSKTQTEKRLIAFHGADQKFSGFRLEHLIPRTPTSEARSSVHTVTAMSLMDLRVRWGGAGSVC
jgi:FkbM family methyltransferase